MFTSHKNMKGFRKKIHKYRPEPSSESRNEITFKCYSCSQKGHKKIDCPINKFNNTKSTFDANKNVSSVATDYLPRL